MDSSTILSLRQAGIRRRISSWTLSASGVVSGESVRVALSWGLAPVDGRWGGPIDRGLAMASPLDIDYNRGHPRPAGRRRVSPPVIDSRP